MTVHLPWPTPPSPILPSLDALAEEEVSEHLWLLLDYLADLGAFLTRTDHLDDRALYLRLQEEILPEVLADPPADNGWFTYDLGLDRVEVHLAYDPDEIYRLEMEEIAGHPIVSVPLAWPREERLPKISLGEGNPPTP